MLIDSGINGRSLKEIQIQCDLAVVGGGLAGVCCAITAARAGLKVTLVQDRPVLGGNASSEVRLWVLGATSHMGNNNRWAREGGVVDEILVENMYRNREGNPCIFDSLLLEKVSSEPNITLLLNTAVYEAAKSDDETIASVKAFCSQNSTLYEIKAPLFCDASGDGIVGFLAGAAFRMGAEPQKEFGEKFAPSTDYGELLGHSIYFYSKDTGHPVKYVAPKFALDDITKIPRFHAFSPWLNGCRLWWIEYGGRMDTVHDTEKIKWELWKVVYGVWDYIKNSGKFPEAETLTLEWVGTIPGKRESRRFVGDYILTQQDIIEQRQHADAVSHGGWSIDLHPADGVYSPLHGCNQWHSKGVYQIPYRCLYSRNIRNLFLAGRIISSSHVAFGSTRVIGTSSASAQAVGIAAMLCHKYNMLPRDLLHPLHMPELQHELLRLGQHIPGFPLDDTADLARQAVITASSEYQLDNLPPDGPQIPLTSSWAMILPVTPGRVPKMSFVLDVADASDLEVQLRVSSKVGNHTPDVTLESRTIHLEPGDEQAVTVSFDAEIERPCYAFVCLLVNPMIKVRCSERRLTGILAVSNRFNPAVAKSAAQTPPGDIGIDSFEFWCPERRPAGHNLAIHLDQALMPFRAENVTNGITRPTDQTNAWAADINDPAPCITLRWNTRQSISRVELGFDTDFDHPMESSLMGHPEDVVPFCVRRYRLRDADGNLLYACEENHQTHNTIQFSSPVQTNRLIIEMEHPGSNTPASMFQVRCYNK